ncbi:uncharacterized protein FOMMEDRAFT_114065 [Fomitiporia mediterranea MF3/22]|uniref:uncharacterized protein n=1 Tax=Fomitiporia mediterranea (strain MF3/22) TaxID=694068 RepID=UPI0004408B47|nr:uncharacterized protein FOMMEDRAFT_114065 [Fomitiporia mediterranea MF3/22]EJC98817.1 hypothetical protein FOMMEDRAFT_114065 [Fomitiporia mediterranea MF3/22]
MFSLSDILEGLISSLPPHPIAKDVLDKFVDDAIEESKQHTSSDNRKSQWEYLLRNKVYELAEHEGSFLADPDGSYYDSLCDRLDVILTFTEREACDPMFMFTVLEDLLETQTVASCSHIFSWIERRSARLTEGMVPQKGKALVLLRMLNDLLRRLSRAGNTTTFCGRILTFLSAVFPLGDRSGVNLRGDYGPQWEPVSFKRAAVEEKMEVDEAASGREAGKVDAEVKAEVKEEEKGDASDKMDEDRPQTQAPAAEKTEEEKKEELYNTFWSLQLPFSRPSIFATEPNAFAEFKTAVNTVMPVIKEATIKERAMMGSKVVAGALKRKRESTPTATMDDGDRKYFFAKFLTSPELLDLEIADTQFRRQVLFQLLILLTHVLQFTAAEKQNWATPRNRSLQMDFTLQPDDAKWVQETITRVYDEMRQTSPNAKAFTETVQTTLEREKNWVRWKNDLCSPFDKAPLPVSLFEETAPIRAKMREPMEEYPHKLGSEALTEIWAMGYRDLYDLENRFNPGDVKDFVKGIEKENARIKLRKQQLEKQLEARARAMAASKPATPSPAPATSAGSQPVNQPPTPASTPVAPIPQRPPPPSASSPPLHPSLPAKPGTQLPASASPAQPTPVPAAATPQPIAAPTPAIVVRPPEQTDPMIMKAEETKLRLSWLALRLARDEYLHHFGKIGSGDAVLLAQEIEKEKERLQRGESQPASGPDRGNTPSAPTNTDSAPMPQTGQKDISAEATSTQESTKLEVAKDTLKPSDSMENNAMPVDS